MDAGFLTRSKRGTWAYFKLVPGALDARLPAAHRLVTPRRRLRRIAGEFLGSALLAAVVIGSGIAAQQLSPTDTGLAAARERLRHRARPRRSDPGLQHRCRGAHFNPVVSARRRAARHRRWLGRSLRLPARPDRRMHRRRDPREPHVRPRRRSRRARTDRATLAAPAREVVATAGLVLVIFALARTGRATPSPHRRSAPTSAPPTSSPRSTSFANPAITIGRMFSDTFAGIAPTSALLFIAAQLVGGLIGLARDSRTLPTVRVHAMPRQPTDD